MLCPYCLHKISGSATKCHQCEKEISTLYRKHYPRGWFSKGPLIMSAVGFSGHGKTVYLASLLHVLQTELTEAWGKFYRQGLEQESINTVKTNLQMLEEGLLPESTRRNFPHPSIHLLAKMPKHGDKMLIAYDPPGEAFEESLRMEQYAHFVTRANTVLFLVSLVDLEQPFANNMQRLLENYTLCMDRLKAKTKRQHLVVVYTKADLLLQSFLTRDTQPALVDYLEGQQTASISDVNAYFRDVKAISEQLAAFTNDQLKARGFINMAEDKFKSVSYCAVSALGQKPVDGKLSAAMQPRRVVDPLLWVVERG